MRKKGGKNHMHFIMLNEYENLRHISLCFVCRLYGMVYADKKVNKSKMKYYTYISNSCLQNWQFCAVACPISRPKRMDICHSGENLEQFSNYLPCSFLSRK